MKGFEGAPQKPTPDEEKKNEVKEGQQENKETESPEDPSRRSFLTKLAVGMGAASLGLGISEEAEARTGRTKTEQIGKTSVEYIGFEPSTHESKLIEIKLKQYLPTAVSVQFSFDKPMRHINNQYMTQMYMNALMEDGSIVVCRGDLRDIHTDSGNLAEKITNLFDNLENGNGIHKRHGKDEVFSTEHNR